MAAIFKALSDKFSPNKQSALSALQEVESAIDAIEQQKATIETQRAALQDQLTATQADLEGMKNFRDMHAEKMETWKKQDEYTSKLRRRNPNIQIGVSSWTDYKAALGDVLIHNAVKPYKRIQVYFLGTVPDQDSLNKILPGYHAYDVEVWSLADVDNPVQLSL